MTPSQKDRLKQHLNIAMSHLYSARYTIPDPMDGDVFNMVAKVQDELQKLQSFVEDKK